MKYAILTDDKKFEIKNREIKVKKNPIIKVDYVGVCGTDFNQWKEGSNYRGLQIGHEYSGTIVDPGTTGLFKKGDKVAGYTQNVFNEACGHCEYCLMEKFDDCNNREVKTWKGGDLTHPGAYAEYTTWFPKSTYILPEGVELEEAALIEPFAVGLHAVLLTDIQPDDKVLILGGGIIGLAVSEWARLYGASEITITEMNEEKMGKIKKFGIVDNVIKADDPKIEEKLSEISEGGYDIVFDCIGIQSAVDIGMRALKDNFKMKFTGLALPHNDLSFDYDNLVLKEIIFKGSKGHNYNEFKSVANLIANQRINVKKYITSYIDFSNLQEGFIEMENRNGVDMKTIIRMDK